MQRPLLPSPRQHCVRAVCGFTLIELLIAIVIIGVLAAVALPSFRDSIRKSRRTEAFAALSQVQLAQERWRANHITYAGSVSNAATGSPPGLGLNASTPSNYYTIDLPAATDSGYTAVATAIAGSSQANDGDCAKLGVQMDRGNISYGSGAVAATITYAPGDKCWSR